MAITATTSILTGNDWQYAKDIRPGDWVFNRFGKPVKVKTAQMYRSEDCYRVTFDDYLSLDGDNHTALPVEDRQYRKHALAYRGVKPRRSQLKRMKFEDLHDVDLIHRGTRAFYSVPTTEPIELPTQPLGIPPFVFGFWFFARLRSMELRVPHEFAEETYQKFKDAGYSVEKRGNHYDAFQKFRTSPSIWDQLRGQQTRKIPLSYLNGSKEQRMELIQGILCTKPCRIAKKAGNFSFHIKNKHFAVVIQLLAESLGAKTTINLNKVAKTYQIKIKILSPFLEQMAPQRPVVHLARRYVKSIERIPAQLCVHIETDEENGTFLAGEGFIPCH